MSEHIPFSTLGIENPVSLFFPALLKEKTLDSCVRRNDGRGMSRMTGTGQALSRKGRGGCQGTIPLMSGDAETLLRKFRHASKYDEGYQEEYLCHDGQGPWYIDPFGHYTKFRVTLALGDDA